MASLPPTSTLQAFESVARRRSFGLAANELHLTASAVSHQVAKLEQHLGVRLFERSAHGVRLSTAGERYLSRISGALIAITAASEDLRQGVSNSLYVHSAPSIASLWLMPRIRAFTTAYPEISLNLSAAHTPSDFALGQADIDIRYGIPQWPELVVEPLFEERIVPLASPAFIKEHQLRRPEQLLDIPLIQSNVSVVQWSSWFSEFTLDAATQGLGVALESTTTANLHLSERKLRPVFAMDMAIKVKAHFAVYPPRHSKRKPVEAFLTWLHQEAAKSS